MIKSESYGKTARIVHFSIQAYFYELNTSAEHILALNE